LGHPSRLKIDTLARPFSEEVFAMDILAESRFTFRQGHTVQPFAMASGKKVCRYQDVSKESQTRGHSVRIVWQIEAQKKCTFVSVKYTFIYFTERVELYHLYDLHAWI